MITLDSTTQKLQAVLGGAVSATNPQITVTFFDDNQEGMETKYANKRTNTNGATDVDICAAPQQSFVRNIESVFIHNLDSASVTLTIKIDDGGTETIIWKAILATLECATYEHGNGWRAYTTAGAVK